MVARRLLIPSLIEVVNEVSGTWRAPDDSIMVVVGLIQLSMKLLIVVVVC